MKKLLLTLLGIVIAVVILYVVYKPAAIAPNGDLTPTPSAQSQAQIIVTEPAIYDTVSDPIVVTGRAIAFESTIAWRLRGADGKELAKGSAMTNAPDVGQYGDFVIRISIPVSTKSGTILTVDVFESSAKDGSEINKVSVPVEVR